MRFNRCKLLVGCLSVLILSVSSPTTGKTTYIKSVGTLASTQAYNTANTLHLDTKAPGSEDIPALLEHAGIPLEYFRPSILPGDPSSPMSEGDYQWHTFFGSTGIDPCSGIAVDDDGGVYIIGLGDLWYGPSGQAPLHYPESTYTDVVILKLDSTGAYQWHTYYGSPYWDFGIYIAVNSSGIYITIESFASWNGPSGQAALRAYSGEDDIAVLKLNTNGIYQWHTFYGTPSYESGGGIALDNNGGVYITGGSEFWTGPSDQAPLHNYSGQSDIFVVKLDSAGTYQWHTFYGATSGEDGGDLIAIDGSGWIYICGASDATWGGPSGQSPLHGHTGSGDFDITVLKLDSLGAYQWHTFYGSTDYIQERGMAVNNNGDVYVLCWSDGSWNGPSGQEPLHAYSGKDADIAVFKLDAMGVYQWHTFYGGAYNDTGWGLASADNGVYIGFDSYYWSGPEGQPPLHAFSGSYDFALLKLDSAGTYQWHTFYGYTDYDEGHGIAIDSNGSIYITGSSDGTWN